MTQIKTCKAKFLCCLQNKSTCMSISMRVQTKAVESHYNHLVPTTAGRCTGVTSAFVRKWMKAAGELLNKRGERREKQKSVVKNNNTKSVEEKEQNPALFQILRHTLNILSCSLDRAHTHVQQQVKTCVWRVCVCVSTACVGRQDATDWISALPTALTPRWRWWWEKKLEHDSLCIRRRKFSHNCFLITWKSDTTLMWWHSHSHVKMMEL